jgi:hypothetical protein
MIYRAIACRAPYEPVAGSIIEEPGGVNGTLVSFANRR